MPQPTPQQLLAELTDDPAGLGYAAVLGQDNAQAALLNAKTAGTSSRYVPIGEFSQWLTVSAIRFKLKAAERNEALSALVKDYIDVVFGLERNPHVSVVDPAAAGAIVTGLQSAGVVDQDDVDSLNALFSTPVSRAEVLWGVGVVISPAQVAEAYGRGS